MLPEICGQWQVYSNSLHLMSQTTSFITQVIRKQVLGIDFTVPPDNTSPLLQNFVMFTVLRRGGVSRTTSSCLGWNLNMHGVVR